MAPNDDSPSPSTAPDPSDDVEGSEDASLEQTDDATDEEAGDETGEDTGIGRMILVVAGVVAALVAVTGGVLWLVSNDDATSQANGEDVEEAGDPRSAAEGPEGSRGFEGLPLDLPESLLPDGAEEVEGQVLRVGESWSASTSFTVRGDHEEFARAGDAPLAEDGFVMRQRAYDETTMQVIYDRADGAIMTVTYTSTGQADEVRVAAVLVGP